MSRRVLEGPWGALKLIRIEDIFLIKFGGRPGYDYREMFYQFQPKPISQFNASPFGIGIPFGEKGNPRMIIKADTTSYALKFPAIETMEGKLEKALGITYKIDTEKLGDDDFEDDEDEEFEEQQEVSL